MLPVTFPPTPAFDPAPLGIVPPGPAAPALIRGSADLSTFPGVAVGALPDAAARTVVGAQLQAALDWCAANGKYAELPPGRYEYIATATQGSRNTGLHAKPGLVGLIGAGAHPSVGTRLVQFAQNHPALTISDVSADVNSLIEGATFGGFCVGHGASQAGQTSADGLLLGRIWRSRFNDLYVSPTLAGGTFHAYCGVRIGLSGSQFFFSNQIGTLTSKSGQAHLFRCDANSTGCVWDNLYLGGISTAGGAGTFGARLALSAEPVFLNCPEFGTVRQLNIEWCSSASQTGALRVDNCNGFKCEYAHFEGDQINNFDGRLIIGTASRVRFDMLNLLDIWIASANASGTPCLLRAYGGAGAGTYEPVIDVGALQAKWNGAGYNAEAVASTAFQLFRDDTTILGRKPKVTVRNAMFAGHTGALSLDANTAGAAPASAGAITEVGEYRFNKSRSETDGASLYMANANLTVYGQHRRAKVTAGTTLTANRTLTLSDKVAASGAGAASVRQAGDILEVHRTAGGAFDLVVADQAAATLYTFSGSASANTAKSFEWSGTAWVAL